MDTKYEFRSEKVEFITHRGGNGWEHNINVNESASIMSLLMFRNNYRVILKILKL